MPPKNKTTSCSAKKGKGAKNSRIAADYESDPTSGDDEPPTSRAASHSAKKRKMAKKSRVAAEQDSDLTSGDDQPSVRDALKTLTSMMSTMSSRLDGLEDGGPNRRRVAFADHLEDARSSEEAAPGTLGGRPAGRRTAGEDASTAAAAAPAVT